MTAPIIEFDYSSFTRTIYLNDRYQMVYTLYDHSMCGPCMFVSTLCDVIDNVSISLRVDGPCGDGVPCFDDEEILGILRLANANKNNTLNLTQIICCLDTLTIISKHVADTILLTYGISIYDMKDAWSEDDKFTCCFLDREFCIKANDIYPVPKVYPESLNFIQNDVYGYVIDDNSYYINEDCMRKLDNLNFSRTWNKDGVAMLTNFVKLIRNS